MGQDLARRGDARAPLRIISPFHASSGYAKMGRAAMTAARLAGFRVAAVESDYKLRLRGFVSGRREMGRIPLTDTSKLPEVQAEELREAEQVRLPADAPTLFIQLPVQLGGWSEYSAGPRLGWTMLESDTVIKLWARQATNVDHLLLPSGFCAEAFHRAIPAVSQSVLPLPVDTRLYCPDGLRAAIPARPDFLFFSAFTTAERKNWRLLMQAVTEEFVGESVGLLCLPSRAEEVNEFAASCRNAGAWIMVMEEWVSEEDLAGLYRACDAFALPSAEGFGLTFVEAALCGKPSVALNLGGSAEMVTPETGYPIVSHLAPCIGHLPPLYDSHQNFPTATIEAVRRALRACVEDRAQKGEAALSYALDYFTPEAVAEGLREAVEQAVCRYEVERSIWQGVECEWAARLPSASEVIAPTEPPPVTCLIHARNIERAEACGNHLRQITRRSHVEFVVGEEGLTFAHEPFWVGETPSEAQAKALGGIKSQNFEGFVVLMTDTMTVQPGWWENLARVFALRPDVGVLAPKVLLPGTEEGVRIGERLLFNGDRQSWQLNRTVVLCDVVNASCMAIRPEIWQNLVIDPQFAWHYADADICVQARRLGYEVAATAEAEVIAAAPSAQGVFAARSRDKDYLREAERLAFLRKWKGDF